MRAVIAALPFGVALALCLAAWDARARVAQPRKGDKTCVIDSSSVMSFGQYDPMNPAPLDAQGRVSYRCGNKLGLRDQILVQISLSAGQAGTYQRAMKGGRDSLRYNLYLDPVRTVIWGDGSGGTQVYSAKAQPNNKVVVVPVFGRVSAEQDVAASVYLDTIIVTLDF